MNIKLLFLLILGVSASSVISQQKINGAIPFQNDPAKKYSLYIPSSYDENDPSPTFLALHPFNTRRWDSRSWRDTLSTFAETNGLILICPDGGADGRIDDPIDTAFTSFLLDSIFRAYNINEDALYVIGFSWGGRTTYTYGLRRAGQFAGYIPIGAAINGLTEVGPVVQNATDETIFIIHGQNDVPGTRFYPVRDALQTANACVRDTLIPGVGHTVDFAGRNELLSMAYEWIRTTNCGATAVEDEHQSQGHPTFGNVIAKGSSLVLPLGIQAISLVDLNGNLISLENIPNLESGLYILVYRTDNQIVRQVKILVQ